MSLNKWKTVKNKFKIVFRQCWMYEKQYESCFQTMPDVCKTRAVLSSNNWIAVQNKVVDVFRQQYYCAKQAIECL